MAKPWLKGVFSKRLKRFSLSKTALLSISICFGEVLKYCVFLLRLKLFSHFENTPINNDDDDDWSSVDGDEVKSVIISSLNASKTPTI